MSIVCFLGAEVHTFTATLVARGPAAAVVLSDEQVAAIGQGAKTFAVSVTVNGHTFPGRIATMRGESLLGFNRTVREACGVQAGDTIQLSVALDSAPRPVEVPRELADALAADASAAKAFEALAYSHRKEFARWVGEAKREETRARRAATTLQMLHAGRTR